MNPEYVTGLIIFFGTLATVAGTVYNARTATRASAGTTFASLVQEQVKDILVERDKQADSDSRKIGVLTDRLSAMDRQVEAAQAARDEARVSRIAAEHALEVAQNEIRDLRRVGLMDQLPDAIVAIDGVGEIKFINQAAIAMFGYTSPQVLGVPLTRLMPERFRRGHRAGLRTAVETGTMQEGGARALIGLTARGEEIPINITITSIRGITSPDALYIGVILPREEDSSPTVEAQPHASTTVPS